MKISCGPMAWKDWAKVGGGVWVYEQPRMLGSAVLHKNAYETILFVLNHYPDAQTFKLEFSIPCKKLVCLTEECDVAVVDGCCELDIDRKNCQIYRVE